MAKRKGNRPVYRKEKSEEEIKEEEEISKKESHRKKNVRRNSVLVVAFSTVFLAVMFIGRWVYAVQTGFYDTYVLVGDDVETALGG